MNQKRPTSPGCACHRTSWRTSPMRRDEAQHQLEITSNRKFNARDFRNVEVREKKSLTCIANQDTYGHADQPIRLLHHIRSIKR